MSLELEQRELDKTRAFTQAIDLGPFLPLVKFSLLLQYFSPAPWCSHPSSITSCWLCYR